jgi:hypothetical protein
MKDYLIYVFCNECYDVHLLPTEISLNDGPDIRKSIEDIYADRKLPPTIAALKNYIVTCPSTGKQFVQQDNHQIYLFPL